MPSKPHWIGLVGGYTPRLRRLQLLPTPFAEGWDSFGAVKITIPNAWAALGKLHCSPSSPQETFGEVGIMNIAQAVATDEPDEQDFVSSARTDVALAVNLMHLNPTPHAYHRRVASSRASTDPTLQSPPYATY